MGDEAISKLSDSQVLDLVELDQNEWWTRGREPDDVQRMLANTDLVVGFCDGDSQKLIAFARVLTARVYKALILTMGLHRGRRSRALHEKDGHIAVIRFAVKLASCSVVFLGVANCGGADSPSARVAAQTAASVAPADTVMLCESSEPGARLVFSGRVLDYGGRPLAKAAVVVHHTNAQGLYNPRDSPTRVPRIRGVAVTDENGAFCFSTIRPGAYPDGTEPAHIHVTVTAPAHRVRDLAYWFEGDPLLTRELRQRAAAIDAMIVQPEKSASGVETFSHDIRLQGN